MSASFLVNAHLIHFLHELTATDFYYTLDNFTLIRGFRADFSKNDKFRVYILG